MTVAVYVGEELGRYGFPDGHPFGTDRMQAFWTAARAQGLDQKVLVKDPVRAGHEAMERFHERDYVRRVEELSGRGSGLLDHGDTPAFPGCYEAASAVVGSSVDAVARIMEGSLRRAFVPIAGLHHARRERAGGFCIFNDLGVVIETLRAEYGLRRIAYVDIDAHHGDGVYYPYAADPEVWIGDIHEDGRFLYPGTGSADERGTGAAAGTKLNLPLLPGADDAKFLEAWEHIEALLEQARPEFILLQAGADSVRGDPLTHLELTPASHAHAARRLVQIAGRHCQGRLLATGGGGYNRQNLGAAWTAVVRELLRDP